MSSRNMESPPRRYGRNNNAGNMAGGGAGGGGGGSGGRRYSRSRSRSRERSREHGYRRRNSRSRSRERYGNAGYRRGNSHEKDLYRDLINEDYKEERNYNARNFDNRSNRNYDDEHYDGDERHWKNNERRERDYERDQRDYDRNRDRNDYRQRHGSSGGANSHNSNNRRYNSEDSEDSERDADHYASGNSKEPVNTIILLGLEKQISKAEIMGKLIQANMAPKSIRVIRKKRGGASRGFAFVEFKTVEEAAQWMEYTKGQLQLQDQLATLQYTHSNESFSDWYCVKCGVYNFVRRSACFKCNASRLESKNGGAGNDEVSNILTKKIMLRNLDALTNEEGVLTVMQQLLPDLAAKISKILVSRDALTKISRGICYLHFETLIDSMNVHNALTALDPPLCIDNRDITVSYCIDHENRQIIPKESSTTSTVGSVAGAACTADLSSSVAAVNATAAAAAYTLADVPRLAEYSASLYASTPAEHAHFLQYYTDYYINEIKKGEYGNLPSGVPLTEANSGAAVALSAMQRKQKKMNSIETTATAAAAAAAQAAAAVKAAFAAQNVVTPKGNDGKVYPTPDVTLYQYDETSGYYYDPTTGLYYDAHSQYYYNNETGAYLYWDQRKSTYVLATAASAQAAVNGALDSTASETKTAEDDGKKEKSKDGNKHDKVKVAKKIVKDMEKWAKQLNQKKDYTVVATPQPILPGKSDLEMPSSSSSARQGYGGAASSAGGAAYADVGFAILEKKERNKLSDYISPSSASTAGAPRAINKLVNAYGSDSDDEPHPVAGLSAGAGAGVELTEKDYVDFQKLTCLLCKRAFQSLEILQKHLKMSNLHKENLAKLKANKVFAGADANETAAALSNYRDRAKERRLKYGESDPPPPNRSRERFENEIKSLQSRSSASDATSLPISSNNVGSRLLQKMGWSEGQGLGRKNQGRTQIIEADTRSNTAGLGNKAGIGPGDDYKSYIKKMMKSRYESV